MNPIVARAAKRRKDAEALRAAARREAAYTEHLFRSILERCRPLVGGPRLNRDETLEMLRAAVRHED